MRTLEWVATSSFRGPPDPGVETESLASPALAGRLFPAAPPGRGSHLEGNLGPGDRACVKQIAGSCCVARGAQLGAL